MAQNYNIPPSTKEEEKAIGGVLTFIQFFWILGGGVLGISTCLGLFSLTHSFIFSIPLSIIVGLSGVPFAFVKKHDMKLFTYIIRKNKFKRRNKKIINRRIF